MTSLLRSRADDLLAPFRPDEPVLQQHPLIGGAVVPVFADDVWDLSAVEGAMNVPPYAKVLRFSWFPTPPWASIARSILMAQLNPNHPVLRGAMIHRSSVRGTNVRTVVELARALSELARWAEQRHLGPLRFWDDNDGLGFVDLQRPRRAAVRRDTVEASGSTSGASRLPPTASWRWASRRSLQRPGVAEGHRLPTVRCLHRAPRSSGRVLAPPACRVDLPPRLLRRHPRRTRRMGAAPGSTRRRRMPQQRCSMPGGGTSRRLFPCTRRQGSGRRTNRTGGFSRSSSAYPSTCSTVGNPAQWQRRRPTPVTSSVVAEPSGVVSANRWRESPDGTGRRDRGATGSALARSPRS